MRKLFLNFIFIFLSVNQTLLGQTDPKLTEVYSNVPIVTPGTANQPPSDAVVLFNGKDMNEWISEKGGVPAWKIEDGIMTIVKGSGGLVTKRVFADCQLHVEWRSPEKVEGEGQNRGNSGVYLQSRYEVQVLDSYNNTTYNNGQAGSIYKQYIPLVNASLKPGQWQSYDIIFTAPRFNLDSTLKSPAYVSVIHNGIVIQNHVEIKGATTYIGQPKYEKHMFKCPLLLQEHGCSVSYRNIWIRELNVTSLFNHVDIKGWYTFLDSIGKNIDPQKNFAVENNSLHIMGKKFGYLCTEKSYSNYYLKVVFKWGTKRFPPRENHKRDSGILYHFGVKEEDKVWPKSLECQVQEDDCGDFWCINTMIESANKSETAWGMKHIFRSQSFENPTGEWNTIEIIANGNTAEYYVNGHLANSGWNATVSEGRIILQSEGAEVFYKDVELMPY
jgi:hypothetical protein